MALLRKASEPFAPLAKTVPENRDVLYLMAVCPTISARQFFASGQEFSYGLEDIGRYYRAYVELMAHWDAVMPGQVLRVAHEEVVENWKRMYAVSSSVAIADSSHNVSIFTRLSGASAQPARNRPGRVKLNYSTRLKQSSLHRSKDR